MNQLEQKILHYLRKEGASSFNFLARKLKIINVERKALTNVINKLLKEKKVFLASDHRYFAPDVINEQEGVYHANSRGYGFVQIEKHKAVFVLGKDSLNALNGDLVKVKYFKDIQEVNRYQGYISQIVKRNKVFFVGTIVIEKDKLTIKPLDSKIKGNLVFVDKPHLSVNDQVKVKIIDVDKNVIKIKFVKILGRADDVAIDILSAIEDANVPYHFSLSARHQAQKLPTKIDSKDLVNRVDLRSKLIVTIDGDDTKDFDDAIDVEKLANGNYKLGVYIADVAYYVDEKSPLDDDARERGTSVYLVDRVVPMLPFELSNGICSLNPNEDRFVLGVQIVIDKHGNTLSYKIFPAVINSKYRLTYQEVNKFYKKNYDFKDQNLVKMLNNALELSKIIRNFKEKAGYIDFEIQESKIIVDKEGKPIDIVARDRDHAEMLIEDFMVRANEVIAQHVNDNGLPFIYRIHDKPDLERLSNLENVIRVLNLDVKIPRHTIPSEFALAIRQIKKFRFDDFMKVMMLRTMAKAIYAPRNIGHFGLASTCYTHFTSPIRRYPDLIVHRLLRKYFVEKNLKIASHFGQILPEIADHCSLTEQRAMELERKVDDIKKAEFYANFIGKSFIGQITSINKFGFFVEFPNKAGGLVHLSTILDGKYQISEDSLILKNNKRQFIIGDQVEVIIVKVSKNEGKIDLVLSEFYQLWKETNLFEQV